MAQPPDGHSGMSRSDESSISTLLHHSSSHSMLCCSGLAGESPISACAGVTQASSRSPTPVHIVKKKLSLPRPSLWRTPRRSSGAPSGFSDSWGSQGTSISLRLSQRPSEGRGSQRAGSEHAMEDESKSFNLLLVLRSSIYDSLIYPGTWSQRSARTIQAEDYKHAQKVRTIFLFISPYPDHTQ